jgi:hypothetical protein
MMTNLTRSIRLRGRLITPPSAALSITWGAGEFCYAVSCADKAIATVGLGWASGDTSGTGCLVSHMRPFCRLLLGWLADFADLADLAGILWLMWLICVVYLCGLFVWLTWLILLTWLVLCRRSIC